MTPFGDRPDTAAAGWTATFARTRDTSPAHRPQLPIRAPIEPEPDNRLKASFDAVLGLLSIDPIAIPTSWDVDHTARTAAAADGARLSDHDLYTIDVTPKQRRDGACGMGGSDRHGFHRWQPASGETATPEKVQLIRAVVGAA